LRYLFEEYAFDTDRRELYRGDGVVPLAPQVFDLLYYLICNRERVVSKEELGSNIWKGRVVSDAALTTRLRVARSAIGDSGEQQRLIKTLPRKGWRFVGVVGEAQGLTAGAVAPGNPAEPSKPGLTLPDMPSIAVLAFQNMSGDVEQEYFADGIVDDIITGLSRSKSLFVIARSSSFTYKGKAIDVKRVGRELGVRYVLEGSVRKAGDRVRITGQLIDAVTGNHIWADRYESKVEDMFDLQDRVTMSIIGAIAPQLQRAEIARAQRKRTESLQAYDYYLRALAGYYRFTREANIEAFELAGTANTLDPDFAASLALGAECLVQRWAFRWSSGGPEDVTEAWRLARRAIELDKDDPAVLALAGMVRGLFMGEVEEAATLLARATSLDPNLAVARIWNGWMQLLLGDGDAAIELFQIGLRTSPFDPRIFLAQNGMASAHFLAGRYEDGKSWAKIALQQSPDYLGAYRLLMSCHAMVGQVEEARQTWAVMRQMDPTLRISTAMKWQTFRRPRDIQLFEEAFRIVGMPE
jgi:TolB-like protein/Flp pilus assembly protein TadD